MKQELEALRQKAISSYIQLGNDFYKGLKMDITKFSDFTNIKKYLDISQALTPPTKEQVCKALSEYYNKDITYNSISGFSNEYNKDSLVIGRDDLRQVIAYKKHNGNIIFYEELPPHLLILLGRFYKEESQ